MKRLFLVLVLVLGLATTAFAFPFSTAKLAWTLPTTTVDGQPINADTALTDAKIYCGKSSGQYTVTKSVGLVAEYKVIDIPLAVGTWYCVETTFNKYGESGYSNEKQFVLEGSVPAAVTDLDIK